jgi:hypothetical protein
MNAPVLWILLSRRLQPNKSPSITLTPDDFSSEQNASFPFVETHHVSLVQRLPRLLSSPPHTAKPSSSSLTNWNSVSISKFTLSIKLPPGGHFCIARASTASMREEAGMRAQNKAHAHLAAKLLA